MDANEQNDDEMILVVVGDDDGTKKYETSESSQLVPISVKIEPIEDARGLYCTEDVREIFPIAPNRTELIEVQPDIEVLDEECLSQGEFLEDVVDTRKTESNIPQKKHARRKTHHEYLIDETEYPMRSNASSKTLKTKTNVSATKHTPKEEPVSDGEDFFEVEFLEDDIDSAENASNKTPVSDEDAQEIEFLDVSSKKSKRKKKCPPKKYALEKTPITDEEYLEIEFLDPNQNKRMKEDDEEYLPEEDQEEFIKEEYIRPKRKKKTNVSSRSPGAEVPTVQASKKLNSKSNITSKRTTQKASTLSKKSTQKPTEKAKTVKSNIKSFIAELRNKQPLFKENEDELVEYLANLMRKRRPAPPLPNSYLLKADNEYSCSYCDVDSPTEAAASRHYQHSHGPRYLVCYACGDDFRSTANLYKHEKRCRAPDADIQLRARGVFLGCKGRGRPYLTNNKFIPKEPETREIPQEKPTRFYCPQCPAEYVRNSLLKEHMHKHTGFRPFQCHECPATYVSRHQLNRHCKKHSNEQFVCDHCGKVLKMKSSLVSHMDTHLPRPRFGCGRCGRRYSQRSAVRTHIMRDHMNLPPPAACPICPKRYNRMSHVKSHMKRDHGLILMTKNAIVRNLPYMKLEDLEGAKIVFNSPDNDTLIDVINPEEEILP